MFDLIIIGGGPGGYNAAERAGHAGLSVCLFEKRSLGGVCLNEGCIPSKALLYSAKIFDYANHGSAYGVTTTGASLDQKAVVARKDKIVRKLVAGVGAKLNSSGVTVVKEAATILGKKDGVITVEAEGEKYEAKNLIIATGSTPLLPPIPGLREAVESGFGLTNREILALTELPGKLAVIGGGVIGLEMASYYKSAGCEVTVIEMLNQIGGPIDEQIADNLLKNYKRRGVEFKLGCKVTRLENGLIEYEKDGKTEQISADKVLISIGRKPVTEGFGLETLGVYTERGAIVTDDNLRTNLSGVYAIGDVNGKLMLAHTAYREGEVAVNTILGNKDTMRYNAIPSVIYTNPEVACVGETEQSAKEKGYSAKTIKLSMSYSGRYLAENEGGDGFVKLVYDEKSDRLLGVSMIGNSTSESIYGAAIMIERQIPLKGLKEIVFPHPTVCEVIRETLFEL